VLDIRATGYISPLAEMDFAPVPLTVHLVNVADETGLVTAKFRIYNSATGNLVHTSEIIPVTMTAGQGLDVSALTDWDPPAPLDDTYFVLFDGNASNPLVPDGIGIHLGSFYFDVKPAPLGPIPAGHHVTHEFTGIDEVDVTDLSGLLADPQTPILHHLEHEDGGSDKINVAGLTGELADDQPPKAHGNAAHTSTFEDQANKGIAGGYCGLPNPLDTTRPLRADGTPDFINGLFVEQDGLALVSADSFKFPWAGAAVTGGSATALAAVADHPGIWRATSAAGGNTGFRWTTDLSNLLIAGSENITFILRPQTLANSMIRFGFLDTNTAADATDGCYFEMATVLAVPGTLIGKCAAAGVRSSTATSFVMVTNTWYRAKVEVNAAANLVTFTLYSAAGAVLWTDTVNANIPTAAGQESSSGMVALSSGTVPIVDLDYIALHIARALVR